jgi:glycosyltransferase involved in cell wall biosynthesis
MPSILFLIAYPLEDSSCRYRIHQFLPFFERAGYQCTVSSFASERLFHLLHSRRGICSKAVETLRCSARRLHTLRHISDFDFVVIHREAFPFLQPFIENWVLRHHSRVLFSFDDAIYAGHERRSELSHPFLYRVKHGPRYDSVIRDCKLVIAGNRILADYARRLTSRVAVIPTVVDTDAYAFDLRKHYRAGPVTIAWMGSPSTVSYLKTVEPALRRLVAELPGQLQFRFIGCPEYAPVLSDCTSLPFVLAYELDDLQSFDIGLMPLPDSEWARGKCAFKAIQYMASGAVTVASPVGITTELIRHNVNGLLAASEDEWVACLRRLVTDCSLRVQLASAARRTIEESYSLKAWAPRLLSLFEQFRGAFTLPETVAAWT